MNIRLLLFSLIALCSACQAQQKGIYRLDFELSKHDFADTIPIEYRHDRVFLPVIVNGEQRRFLLDTGAGHAVVYDDKPIEGCTPSGTIASHDAIGRRDTVSLVKLPPLSLGSLTLTGCQATLQHRPIRNNYIDGILGFDLVCKGLQMKIDARQHILILTDRKDFFAKEGGHQVKYRLQFHVPYLNIEPFKGYRERVLFDTGSRSLYAINKKRFDAAEKACLAQNAKQIEGRSWGHHAIGFQGVEPSGEVVFLDIDNLRLGKFAFHHVHTLTTQGGSHLGAQLLKYGSVVFNPRKKTMCFQPYDNTDFCVVNNKQLEKAIINENGLPVVGLIWERSEAYQAGLRQGDIILKADSQPIASFAEYVAFRPLRGRIYTFTVRDRRNFLKEVKMKW